MQIYSKLNKFNAFYLFNTTIFTGIPMVDVVIWRQLSSAFGLRRRLGQFHDAKIRPL